ncbi:aminotransferase class V-fold PLP-dependent enzyme [Streptomyces spongiicola]|uniref:Aminotransferase class V-fold PLP-dependent enzyme n=1 Tax=Streptomyces spongiicola TaxID=1690221 RepID=A0A388SSL5_9ACTN|nr:aminotransferase class V-fold PLP-dependent enzyme [Streptomyces spongiicola]GBP99612.1 aminotransferase class V-fold PLP-dependent enzyme [Streptomyces spongiicola]
MSTVSRRDLLAGSAGVAAATLATGSCAAPSSRPARPAASAADGPADWEALRRQFRLEPGWANLALFYLASQPKRVRDAVDFLGAQVDANPLVVPTGMRLPDGPTGWPRVRRALASYIGGRAEDIAMTASTSIGLGVFYNGVRTRPGQEFLLTGYDHRAQRTAAELAAGKHGARVRPCSWFADPATATAEGIAAAVGDAIRPHTRIVGITWVQSSTGLRMPVRAVAAAVRRANEGRAPADRCLLVVDAVHGLAAVDEDAARLGADAVIAGTHKWLFGPRGTGFVWVNPEVLDQLHPTFVSFITGGGAAPLSPGGFLAFEHAFALPVAVEMHRQLGRTRVAARIAELSTRAKRGLIRIPGVTVHTPMAPELSAGITCFSMAGRTHEQIVGHAATRRVRLSASVHTRLGTAVINTPAEVDTAVGSVADLAR